MKKLELVDSLLFELASKKGRMVYIGAMGFEDRTFGFLKQVVLAGLRGSVVAIRYARAKAKNREWEFRELVKSSNALTFTSIAYSTDHAHRFEIDLDRQLRLIGLCPADTVVLDVSALSKFLILVCLLRLWHAGVAVRVVMTTAVSYSPSKSAFDLTMGQQGENVRVIAGQPSVGASAILRSSCLVSARMQGQPVCAIAFTSFNEELIRHAVGTLNPHRLILLNGLPPLAENLWRAHATQAIHSRLIEENSQDNPIDSDTGLLKRTLSTLSYEDTVRMLAQLHNEYGLYERMIYFATGSKMQTVALALHKHHHKDVHVEYPTPDSYFFEEYSSGIDVSYFVTLNPTPEACPSVATDI